jgi:para-aminobenzoate synthetase/4-amino-4-deoxychorismate lyase
MEKAISQGFYLAGFLSYEAGYAFEEKLKENRTYDFPLVYFGVYTLPTNLPLDKGKIIEGVGGVRVNTPYPDYSKDISAIRSHIGSGNVYQITYCLKYKFGFTGNTYSFYEKLLKDQPVPYPAYIKTKDFSILSLSPEMFLKKTKEKIVTKPMKGTWMIGNGFLNDLFAKRRLHLAPKNRAENVMIADLLRNDLGKISKSGSVVTPKLFEVARYRTVCQMTSTVQSVIDPQIKMFDLFKAVFPSGSVTGAPKIRAMQIIRELEKEDRRIYTGAIGYITPKKDMFFNVPIRTLLLPPNPSNPSLPSQCEMGVGGGIVWDSTPEGEWEECRIKARFLTGDLL